MNRRTVVLLGPALFLAACVSGGSEVQLGPDGKPLPRVYRITPDVAQQIPYRFLDSVNTLRSAKGLQPLAFNAQLNAAAETHSRDMSVQNRPWHFGSDGSSPLTRVQRVGYTGKLLGENISETYQTELETLSTWMEAPDQRAIIMDPAARQLGFAWYQEEGGKIWWTMVTGA
ncbi:CAP domain-containing protein [Neotabrizicola sp. VNH66]|uniref:CAP domain-containing protein n=1 Tax=Neotabrizicola sp. VNH66 TaxID=3400918 RepID=UPI003C050F81